MIPGTGVGAEARGEADPDMIPTGHLAEEIGIEAGAEIVNAEMSRSEVSNGTRANVKQRRAQRNAVEAGRKVGIEKLVAIDHTAVNILTRIRIIARMTQSQRENRETCSPGQASINQRLMMTTS